MQFTPTKSLSKENDIDNNKEINPVLLEDNNIFNNSPMKLYCSDITEIDKQNENGWTPIYRSIIANNLNVLSDLLKLGANPNLQNNIGETPLYLCVDIDNYDAINILLKNKADCNIPKKDGTTPLHLATKKKKDKFIKILLEHGANANVINKLYSQTPFHLAIKNKLEKDIILEFKKNGANFYEIKDRYDKTPYDYAKDCGDDNYFNMVKNIFENKEEKEKEKEENNIDEIKYNVNNNVNSNNNGLNLNSLFKNIELNMNNNIDNIDNDFIKDNNIIINEIEEKNKNYLKDIININEIENNDIKNDIEIKDDKKEYINEIKNEIKIKKENDLKENISDNVKEEPKISTDKITEKINNEKEINIKNKPQQIYQPKKTMKRKSIKNNNNKIKPTKINKNIIKKELNKEEYLLNELNTAKGRENNLGLGITLTSSENDIYKSNTVKNMPVLINEPKLSTLSENELLKNIILDTAKKIKNHNINNTSGNISLEQKSNMNIFSPINTIKSETIKEKTKKIFNKTFENGNNNNKVNTEDNKKGMNTMNPLDMMNQIITTNSNISNDTQEQINNKFNITVNNNINNKDSDLLEYSKSYVTNNTHLNNTEENNINNNNGNNNSSKKNECYKKISYHGSKYINKNNTKGINLNNNFNEIENEDENVNEEESFEHSDNNENINNENINSLKYKNLNINNHQNIPSTYDNSKYNSILDNSNNGKQTYYNSQTNSNSNTKYNSYKENIELIPSSTTGFNNNSNISRNKLMKINNKNGQIIVNSISNTTYNSNTNNSSSKKYAKKLAILTELENSKNNQPMKTSISNLDENDSIVNLYSNQNIIPNDLSSKLHDWLISCDLLCYYNLLIKNKLYDINKYINDIKSNKKIISFKSIEDLGIKKPGHIYRFLLKIKLDSNMLEPYIYNAIIDKYSRTSLNDIKISMSNSGYKIGCCCFRDNNLKLEKRSINSGFGDFNENTGDIFAFLKKLDLLKLKENFIHNGFDQVEYIMIQMFSEYKFNKDILNEYLHVYSDEDKIKVIRKLYIEKKNLCQEYNIKYDENEDKDIYDNYFKDYKDDNNDGLCSIF